MSDERKWSIEQEINLFSLVCDFKPAGSDKDKNLTQILIRINENIDNDEKFTEEQVWDKLKDFFDLEKTEDIEKADVEESTSPRAKSLKKEEQPIRVSGRAKSRELSTRESTIEQSPTPQVNPDEETVAKNNNEPELYSSELSDVEGEETELEKLHGREPSPPPTRESKRRGRPKKGLNNLPVKEEMPSKEIPAITPRKRTRSIAKDGDEESTPKKRPLATANSRRKTRSEATPDADSISSMTSQTEEHVNEPHEGKQETIANTETSVEADMESKNTPKEATRENKYGSKEVAESIVTDDAIVTESVKTAESTEAIESTQAVEITEEPKTRRSKRQAVRRSTRNK